MRVLISFLTMLTFFVGIGASAAEVTNTPVQKITLAYIANAANNNIQVVDLSSGKTLRKIYAGAGPWRLVSSPDGKQLLAQHWYSESTAMIDLTDHEIKYVLPYRGPGVFSNDGEQFVTFSWPRSGLYKIDPKNGDRLGVKVTEINKIYDLVQRQDNAGFYMARFDPQSKVESERYSYIVNYPYDLKNSTPSPVSPATQRTGLGPTSIVVSAKEPFLLTADSETNGLSLINVHGDGRGVPTCPAPQAILLSPDETKMAVLCWRGLGIKESYVVLYETDFSVRPWPAITEINVVKINGGLVEGSFDGDKLYVLDQLNRELIELDGKTLKTLRSFSTGDVPMDVELVQVPLSVRDDLLNSEGRSRQLVKKVIKQMQSVSAPYTDLSWRETASWKVNSDNADLKEKGEEDDAEIKPVQDPAAPTQRMQYYKGPNWLRTEAEGGLVRLAQAGTSVSILEDGRFWVTPRQNLLSSLYGLSSLSVDEVIQRLAGDVPGSPYLRSGIAVDVVMEFEEKEEKDSSHTDHDHQHEEDHEPHRYYVIGANEMGQAVPQLWVDVNTAYPTNLIEKFPVNKAEGHQTESKQFGGIIETKFYDYKKIDNIYSMPSRLERVLDNGSIEEVKIDQVKINSGIPDEKFDLALLGDTRRVPKLSEKEDGAEKGKAASQASGEYIYHPLETHEPYSSNPPTSGAHLPFIADWGAYQVPLPLALQVYNLKAGGVVIQYNCRKPCPDTVAKLEGVLERYPEYVLLAPYPLMESKIAVTAWGKLETFDEFDEASIVNFIEINKGIAHHADSGDQSSY